VRPLGVKYWPSPGRISSASGTRCARPVDSAMAYMLTRPAVLVPCLPHWMKISPRLPSSRWLAVRYSRSAPMVTAVVCPLRRLGKCG
jgi:hypothetical protein